MRRVILFALSAVALFAQRPSPVTKLAPYVASPSRAVDRMLELANIKPGETVMDLGSGDGRILIAAARKYNAKGVGVEISPKLVSSARSRVELEGLSDRVKILEGDLFTADVSSADVVVLYLDSASNKRLEPRLARSLKPGARVISKDYGIPGWKPNRVEHEEGKGAIYYYEVPPTKQ